MDELQLFVELAGDAALLLWGLHMVQSGVQRAFGGRLQAALGVALGQNGRALLSGLGVTLALQSSTATALMVGSFAATGAVALAPALAAMLGANIGTALSVQALSFDASWIFPIPVLIGVIAFRQGSRSRTRDLGRAGIGLGLMLLALHLMMQTLAPVETSPILRAVLAALAGSPFICLVLAAIIAWAAHSSVAGVLFVASLASAGTIGAGSAMAMVLGANLGSALNPLLEAGGRPGDPARLRLPVGNLVNRLLGCALGLALLPQATAALLALDDAPARLVANAHLAFNLGMAALAYPLLRPLAVLLARLLPERVAEDDPGLPRYLDAAATGTPSVALSNATREVLRIADLVEAMLEGSARCFIETERDTGRPVTQLEDAVRRLNRALQAYLAAIPTETLGDEEALRLAQIQSFAIALEQAADVLSRDLVRLAAGRARRGLRLSAEGLGEIAALHATLRDQLRLGVAVFLTEDVEAARRLVQGKEALRETEKQAAQRLATAGTATAEQAAAQDFVLEVVRDLRRIGAIFAGVAHPLLERRGELLASRLREQAPGETQPARA